MEKPPRVESLQTAIGYLYLMAFCPPQHAKEFQQAGLPLRTGLAATTGLPEQLAFAQILPEVCHRIVAFHLRTREPDKKKVDALLKAAFRALSDPEAFPEFQALMTQLAASPGRAKADNRLRADKGCQYCASPCGYGFFLLVTKPNYALLQKFLEAEAKRPAGEQDPLRAGWSFATAHLWRALGSEQGYISPAHLGNLAYCLLALGMAKSRYPLPGQRYQQFQETNQAVIRTWPAGQPSITTVHGGGHG